MSAVISSSNPGAYLREMADMEHDIVRTVEQADAAAGIVNGAADPLTRIDELFQKILRERGVLRHEREEINALIDNAEHREAVIGELQAKLDAELDKIKQASRS